MRAFTGRLYEVRCDNYNIAAPFFTPRIMLALVRKGPIHSRLAAFAVPGNCVGVMLNDLDEVIDVSKWYSFATFKREDL